MTREELKAKAETLYPIHEDDLSLIRNIREYEQKAYIQGYDDARKELVHAPNDPEGITAKELKHQMYGYKLAKKEFGWHKYPQEKPTKKGDYICRFKNSSRVRSLNWDEEFPWVDIEAWMPIPEEGGER